MLNITSASITDQTGATCMMNIYTSFDINVFPRLLKILVDGGYTDDKFANKVKELTGVVRKFPLTRDTIVLIFLKLWRPQWYKNDNSGIRSIIASRTRDKYSRRFVQAQRL